MLSAETIESSSEGGSALAPLWLTSWLENSGLVRAKAQDLALLGRTKERHVAAKLVSGVAGLLIGPAVLAFAYVLHIGVPVFFPVGLSLILGVVCFFGPDGEVRTKAGKARTEFNKILHSYLVSVALERRANRGIMQALDEASRVGDSWVLQRIRSTLLAAQISNMTPWQALEELGANLGIPHLAEAAQTMRSASQEGTAVFTRLLAQAESLGDAVLAEERAIAAERSERMIIPVSAMGMVIIIMMAYPLSVLIKGVT